MTTFKHWYDHRQLEFVFHTAARASQAAYATGKHLEAAAFHHGIEESTSLETISDFTLPEWLVSTSKAVIKNRLGLNKASICQDSENTVRISL